MRQYVKTKEAMDILGIKARLQLENMKQMEN